MKTAGDSLTVQAALQAFAARHWGIAPPSEVLFCLRIYSTGWISGFSTADEDQGSFSD
jgi:hypothetical protein